MKQHDHKKITNKKSSDSKGFFCAVACVASLSACAEVSKTEPTDEEEEIIQESIESMRLIADLTLDVAKLADPEILANEHNQKGSIQDFQKGVTDAKETVISLWQEDRVFVYDVSDVVNPDVSFVDDSGGLFGGDALGDFIGINRTLIYTDTAKLATTLLHEGAHAKVGHTDKINELYEEQNDGNVVGPESFGEAAIASNDFPYQLSHLSIPGEFVVRAADNMLEFDYVCLEGDAERGDWVSFQDRLESYKTEGSWENKMDGLYRVEDFLTDVVSEGGWMEGYGIDGEELMDVVRESKLYRHERESFLREIDEISRELKEMYDAPPEASYEMRMGQARR